MTGKSLTVADIARAIGATVEGDSAAAITGVGSIDSAVPGEVTFASDERRAQRLPQCRASAAVVKPGVPAVPGLTLLRVADPEAAFAVILGLLAPPEDLPPVGVHPSAVIAPDAEIGLDVAIGPHVVIGSGARIEDRAVLCANAFVGAGACIGQGTVLFPGVVVREYCTLGQRCRIHANAVIGADGFGYFFRNGVHHKVPHIGVVEIGSDVEIGACSCIDRAKFGATRIGDGTKIDNLVQVAHNVQIGRGVILVAGVRIGGSAIVGDYAVLGGGVGVRDNVSVGSGVRATAYSGITRNVEPGQEVGGFPAIPVWSHLRSLQLIAKLPELKTQIKELQARLDAIEESPKNDRH